MQRRCKRRQLASLCIILLAAVILLSPNSIWACSVPVFEYALAYWFADPYEVIIFHRGPLSSEELAVVDRLQRASLDSSISANVNVRTVDLANSPGVVMQKLWEAQSASELPWMLVRYPRFSTVSDDVWAGRLTLDAVDALLDSPIRKEIARRILDGEVAVWVLLESGIKEQDEAASSLLKAELKRMSDTLEIILPELGGAQLDEVDTSVSFSVAPLSRSDPAERMFVQMLLNSEWDLKTIPRPMAFPVFGRGRALYALVGDGIRESNIEMACSFLVGWCSCQVKADNPGVDLLMSVNWDEMVSEELYDETRLLLASEPTATDGGDTGAVRRNIVMVVLIQVLIVAVVACAVLWRKRQKRNA